MSATPPPSLAIRITVAFLAVTVLVAAILLAAFYWALVHRPLGDVRGQVAQEARQMITIDRGQSEEALRAALERRRADWAGGGKAFDALIGRDGRLIAGNLPSWPAERRGDWVSVEADLYRDGDEDDHDALMRDVLLPGERRLLVGRDVELYSDRRELMIEATAWTSVAVLFLGLIGGLLTAVLIGRRLRFIDQTAQAVLDGDLSVRVPVLRGRTDFDQMSRTLNAMLDRNERLVASLGRVSDNVAHELRTPLARLRTYLEQAADANGAGQRQRFAEQSLAEVERLQTIIDALMRIARLDTKRHQLREDKVQLDVLAADAVELYLPSAEARALSLRADGAAATISGDRDLLFQAIANLIDNAVKFAPEGGTIEVTCATEPASATISIRDSGSGVAEEHRESLGERFFRAPQHEAVAGTGLGLALAKAIAKAHGGSLEFERQDDGFEARIRLPLGRG